MNEILSEGLAMMFIGMGTVLIFLCIMIIAMNIMSWAVTAINKIFPEAVSADGGNKKVATSDDSEIAAAIAAVLFRR